MYSILSLMSFNPLPRAYPPPQSIPPHIQGFLHLHPALPAYSNSSSNNNNNNFIRKGHGPWGLLPDLICQPIHHNCKQERESEPILDAILQQSRNSPSYLLGTSSASRYPSTCPLPPSHTSLPLQIPTYNAICLLLAPAYTISKNPQTRN